MSRTEHARGPGTRYARRASWQRAFYPGYAGRPARVARRTERAEVERELVDLDVPDDNTGILDRERRVARTFDTWFDYDRYSLDEGPSRTEWAEWLDYNGCGACDSGCACAMQRYADDAYDDYLEGSVYSDDVMDAGWVNAWVDGQVDLPNDWSDLSREYWLDELNPDGFESNWCDGCGELHIHCEWRGACYSKISFYTDNWCEAEAVPSDTAATIDLVAARMLERERVGDRRRAAAR